MTNKISQANHQSRWLNIEVTNAGGSMIGLLEPAVKAVALVTRLLTITNGEVFPVTRPPHQSTKMTSSVTRPLASMAVQRLWPPNSHHRSSMRIESGHWTIGEASLATRPSTPIAEAKSPDTRPLSHVAGAMSSITGSVN